MAEIVYKRSAARILRRVDRKTAGRVLEALEKLAEDPEREDLDVKPLSGAEGFRLRVGDWRILFDRETVERPTEGREDETEQVEVITVQAIRPRGGAYKQRKRKGKRKSG